jgi:hypothetical protein
MSFIAVTGIIFTVGLLAGFLANILLDKYPKILEKLEKLF